MYSILVALTLGLAVSARPALKNRQFLGHSIAGVDTGIACTIPEGCVDGDIVSCINGEFIVTEPCAAPTTCLSLPRNNSTTDSVLACSTTDIQTQLFGEAFGGIDKIPTD
ncbi:hypothetical protein C8R46DRAFT_375203 [Mycena filopes]|nr:hypothetical protein C8R46DRAFT_375203 [Mycena filopes]